MGVDEKPFLADSTIDHVKYVVKQAYGTEMHVEDVQEFGLAGK